jgi:hypothetical protein
VLTEGWKLYSSGRGNVLSSWAPTTPGMALQCLGWWHIGGDGRTRPEVTEETCSAVLMSRHHPAQCGVGIRTSFEGSAALLREVRRGGRMGVGSTVSQS